MEKLLIETPWQQRIVKMYDKQVITPRLSAWYADETTFDYSSLEKSAPNVWTPELLEIKNKVEKFLEQNSIVFF